MTGGVDAEARAVAVRSFGNNVVLAAEAGREVVLVGKGIGFGVRAGDPIDVVGVEQRFVPDSTHGADRIADVVQDAPLAHLEVARVIVSIAVDELRVEARPGFLLAVLDHLTFAVERAQRGSIIDFPLRFEVAQLYPAESALGRRAVGLVQQRLGVQLQADEWSAFALHIVNQQWRRQDIGRTVAMTETIQAIFALLEDRWGRRIDEEGRDAARFVSHLRFLFARVAEGAQTTSSQLALLGTLERAYPSVAPAARAAAERIESVLGRELTQGEVAYVALHMTRLYEGIVATDE